MSSFKFGQQNVSSKDFYKVIPIDYSTLDVDNIVVSDPITCAKTDSRYMIGYKMDHKIVALRIKTPKNIYSFGVRQYNAGSPWNMGFDLQQGHEDWLEKYIKIWDAVEDQVFQSFTKAPVNKDRYINPKIKEYDGKITTKFHGRDVPYKCCEATGILRLASVYKQGNNCYPQTYLDECKYHDVKQHHGVLLLSDDDEDYYTVR